jgi:hypothetical protein
MNDPTKNRSIKVANKKYRIFGGLSPILSKSPTKIALLEGVLALSTGMNVPNKAL